MFQTRHQPGLSLETADEFGMVGELRQDDFNRHLAFHTGLHSTIHHPETAGANTLAQFIAMYGPSAQIFFADFLRRRRRGWCWQRTRGILQSNARQAHKLSPLF